MRSLRASPSALAVTRPPSTLVQGLVAASLGVLLGGAVVYPPLRMVAGAIAGVVLVPLLVISAPLRLTVLVIGAVIALQSAQTLVLGKLIYILLVAIIVVVSVARVAMVHFQRSPWIASLAVGSSVMLVITMLSVAVALPSGVGLETWMRDVVGYVFLALFPLVAVDFAHSVRKELLVSVLVGAGILTSGSFTVYWLGRRGLLPLPSEPLTYSSFLLSGALLSYAYAQCILGRRPLVWSLLAATVLVAFMVTGTRSTIMLLVPLLATGMYAAASLRTFRARRVVALLAVIAVVGTAGFAALAGSQSWGRLVVTRFLSVPNVVSLGVSRSADPSLHERSQQAESAWQTFLGAPAFGVGPGHVFYWNAASGESKSTTAIDTSLSLLAKFGVTGLIGVLCLVGSVVLALRAGSARASPELGAVIGFAALLAVFTPFGSVFEDKGTSLGLLFLLALALAPRPYGSPVVRRLRQTRSAPRT